MNKPKKFSVSLSAIVVGAIVVFFASRGAIPGLRSSVFSSTCEEERYNVSVAEADSITLEGEISALEILEIKDEKLTQELANQDLVIAPIVQKIADQENALKVTGFATTDAFQTEYALLSSRIKTMKEDITRLEKQIKSENNNLSKENTKLTKAKTSSAKKPIQTKINDIKKIIASAQKSLTDKKSDLKTAQARYTTLSKHVTLVTNIAKTLAPLQTTLLQFRSERNSIELSLQENMTQIENIMSRWSSPQVSFPSFFPVVYADAASSARKRIADAQRKKAEEKKKTTGKALEDCIENERQNAVVCGNGTLESGEQCDGGSYCNTDCTIQSPICGNYALESGEQCDDGNTSDGDMCSSTCSTITSPIMPPTGYCGDGILDTWETCDDGNTSDSDMCSSACQNNTQSITTAYCGNGIVEVGEQCDNGGVATDFCTSQCSQPENPIATSTPRDCEPIRLRIEENFRETHILTNELQDAYNQRQKYNDEISNYLNTPSDSWTSSTIGAVMVAPDYAGRELIEVRIRLIEGQLNSKLAEYELLIKELIECQSKS